MSARSNVSPPGPWILFRPELPNVPGAFDRNAAVLNHCASDGLPTWESAMTSGRSLLIPVSELSLPVLVLNQNPVRLVIIADDSHLLRIRFAQRSVNCGLNAT